MVMTDSDNRWQRMAFKKNKVWMAVQEDGRPVEKSGKVLIKYQRGQDYEYWVHKNNIKPLEALDSQKTAPEKKSAGTTKNTPLQPTGLSDEKVPGDHAICIYTDGASSGNPGPSGIGVLLRHENHEKEISKYIGIATNNIAELEAIRVGLLEVKNRNLPVYVYTDSSYAYGVLVQGWKAKKNTEIVNEIRKIIPRFKELNFLKVKGHAGHAGNERADFLATAAIKSQAPKQ